MVFSRVIANKRRFPVRTSEKKTMLRTALHFVTVAQTVLGKHVVRRGISCATGRSLRIRSALRLSTKMGRKEKETRTKNCADSLRCLPQNPSSVRGQRSLHRKPILFSTILFEEPICGGGKNVLCARHHMSYQALCGGKEETMLYIVSRMQNARW